MIRIKNLEDIGGMLDGVVRRAMETNVELCCADCPGIKDELEEGFSGPLGGNWFQLEPCDDPRNLAFDDDCPIDLLGDAWDWCDNASLKNGCYFVFWGVNNAGGPCLYVPDEPWVPEELRTRLTKLIGESGGRT